MILKKEIKSNEYSPYFGKYINLVDDNVDLISGFENSLTEMFTFFKPLSEEKMSFKYGPDKWSIKELFQHIIDTERIFMYRCFRIGRGDKTPLAGFDQDIFVKPSHADDKTKEELLEEYSTTRAAFLSIIKSMKAEDLAQIGTASDGPMSARATIFIMMGHEKWHIDIVKERYL